jgi:hypothetical protein
MGLTQKTSQFFWEPAPHHDGPSFDSLPMLDAIPPAPVAASHYWCRCVSRFSPIRPTRGAPTLFLVGVGIVTFRILPEPRPNPPSFNPSPSLGPSPLGIYSCPILYGCDVATLLGPISSETWHGYVFRQRPGLSWLGWQLGTHTNPHRFV